MNTTSYEKGIEKGKRDILREQLEDRFGPLSKGVLAQLQEVSTDRLRTLARDVLRADSLRELGLED